MSKNSEGKTYKSTGESRSYTRIGETIQKIADYLLSSIRIYSLSPGYLTSNSGFLENEDESAPSFHQGLIVSNSVGTKTPDGDH